MSRDLVVHDGKDFVKIGRPPKDGRPTKEYKVNTYFLSTFNTESPVYQTIKAQEGEIIGIQNTALGINVIIRHNQKHTEEVDHKFIIAGNDQRFIVDEGYNYLGSVEKTKGTLHVFGYNGNGFQYP